MLKIRPPINRNNFLFHNRDMLGTSVDTGTNIYIWPTYMTQYKLPCTWSDSNLKMGAVHKNYRIYTPVSFTSNAKQYL